MKVLKNQFARWSYCLTGLLFTAFLTLSAFYLIEFTKLEKAYPVALTSSETEVVKYEFLDVQPESWVHIKSMPRESYGAIVVSEDWYFYEHNGVDFSQIKEAFKDYLDGKKLRGASTITQQLIKNLYLTHERKWWRKATEIYLAFLMERVLEKEVILEKYLNIIEFGDELYGIGKASRHYFAKNAESLSSKETAFLAMLLPNPKLYNSSFKEKVLSPYATETINTILKKMKVAGYIEIDTYKESLEEKYSWEGVQVGNIIFDNSDSDYFNSF